MNQRIEKLFEQALEEFKAENKYATIVDPDPLQRDFVEKFAELIVRECADFMYKNYPNNRYEVNYLRKHMGDPDWNKPIEKYFGVDE
jgi:hypothetical protein